MVKRRHLSQTASQTAGPYVHIGLAPGAAGLDAYKNELGWDIAGSGAQGQRIKVKGLIWDADGVPIKDALLELWQADAAGAYPRDNDDFRGWGRAIADFETGIWTFETIKPGAVKEKDDLLQAPHINLWLVARGINIGLNTRLYFSDEEEANARDPVLSAIGEPARRDTLIASREEGDGLPVYRFDIYLRGARETVFFDV